MPYLATVPESRVYTQVTDEFRGYNHNLKINDGEFFDMKNFTSDYYPLLANREKRSVAFTPTNPLGLLGRAQLAYIDGSELYYNGLNITAYLTGKGFSISTAPGMLPKRLVNFGAYICIFPDKLYINVENYSDCGSMEAAFSSSGDVTYSLCKADSTAYQTPTVSPTAPENPTNGDLWIDTSGANHVLREWNSVMESWTEIATVYTKIENAGIGADFKEYDGVDISGAAGNPQVEALNGSHIIYAKGDNYIVIVGILDEVYTQSTGTLSVKRSVPDMDFVIEAENRLWGCKYGLVDGETINEIYSCALGDFKNWRQYLGVSTDSYAASVGTDGPFTGAVTQGNHPIFFKEDYMHKVFISGSGAHQISSSECKGVQYGSWQSVCVVGETAFYKGRDGICAYDGSLPVTVSDALGTEKYRDAVAGTIDNKYYVSMKNAAGEWSMFVLDTGKGLWHREDDTHAAGFARAADELYYIDAKDGTIRCVRGSQGTAEDKVEWEATSGLIGYTTVEHKYISRINFRMMLPKGSKMDFFMEYDSSGKWERCGHIDGQGTNSFVLPIRTRRCDHFRYRIKGSGDIRIYSIARNMEVGSDA